MVAQSGNYSATKRDSRKALGDDLASRQDVKAAETLGADDLTLWMSNAHESLDRQKVRSSESEERKIRS